jgi:transposase InsO family protein
VKYAFIRDELVGTCTTRMACRLLEVSPSGYYQFLQTLQAPRKEQRLAVERAVVRIHTESRRIYGSPKITRELPKLGLAAHTLHATVITDALTMAVERRSSPIGLVYHSDRGVQYACHACRELLEEHGAEHEPC